MFTVMPNVKFYRKRAAENLDAFLIGFDWFRQLEVSLIGNHDLTRKYRPNPIDTEAIVCLLAVIYNTSWTQGAFCTIRCCAACCLMCSVLISPFSVRRLFNHDFRTKQGLFDRINT